MSISKDECILWTGPRRKDGYGRVHVGGKRVYAHRLAYCNAAGIDLAAIDGLEIRHQCDNPQCVNPAHLLAGTHLENMHDKVERNRNALGEEHGCSKLLEAQVIEIRRAYTGARGQQRALAAEYGVSQPLISLIINRKLWPKQGIPS